MSKSLTVSAALCGLAALYAGAPRAATDPTMHQIYEAAQAGQLGQAEQMVEQVLRDYPRSGKAHYVAAEIYARAGNSARASQELDSAQSLDPGLPFAKAESVNELRRELTAAGRSSGAGVPTRASVPWAGTLLLLLGCGAIWMMLRRRSQANASPAGLLPPGAPGSYGGPGIGGMGPSYGGGMGSGLMGNLATGLAVGAGVAAGEELVHHLLDPGRSGGVLPTANADELADPIGQNLDMGGTDFGVSDAGSWGDDGGSFGGDLGGGDWS